MLDLSGSIALHELPVERIEREANISKSKLTIIQAERFNLNLWFVSSSERERTSESGRESGRESGQVSLTDLEHH